MHHRARSERLPLRGALYWRYRGLHQRSLRRLLRTANVRILGRLPDRHGMRGPMRPARRLIPDRAVEAGKTSFIDPLAHVPWYRASYLTLLRDRECALEVLACSRVCS